MSKQRNNPTPSEPREPERPPLNAAIAQHVLHALGQPGGLQSVQVRQLWTDHYRVNVLVGESAVTTRIAHSFFLVADKEGAIVGATPNITRQYEKAAE